MKTVGDQLSCHAATYWKRLWQSQPGPAPQRRPMDAFVTTGLALPHFTVKGLLAHPIEMGGTEHLNFSNREGLDSDLCFRLMVLAAMWRWSSD